MRWRGANPFEIIVAVFIIVCIAELIRGYWQKKRPVHLHGKSDYFFHSPKFSGRKF